MRSSVPRGLTGECERDDVLEMEVANRHRVGIAHRRSHDRTDRPHARCPAVAQACSQPRRPAASPIPTTCRHAEPPLEVPRHASPRCRAGGTTRPGGRAALRETAAAADRFVGPGARCAETAAQSMPLTDRFAAGDPLAEDGRHQLVEQHASWRRSAPRDGCAERASPPGVHRRSRTRDRGAGHRARLARASTRGPDPRLRHRCRRQST